MKSGAEIYKSFDAREWAANFVEIVTANPSIPTDVETMTAWFASALMRGYDEYYWRSPQYKRMVKRALYPSIWQRAWNWLIALHG